MANTNEPGQHGTTPDGPTSMSLNQPDPDRQGHGLGPALRLDQAAARLRALSPRSTLARGYAIVRSRGSLVRSATAVEPGDPLRVEVADGAFGARVE